MNRQPWTPRDVDDLLHGREGSDPELSQLVQQLRAGRRLPAPVGALAQVLAGELAVSDLPTDLAAYPSPATRRTRTGVGKARALVVAAVAGGSLLTGAAAANALPESAQRAAATVLNAVTPFSFPVPQHQQQTPTGPNVRGTRTPEPSATEDPTEEPTHPPISKTGHGGTLRTGHTQPSDEPSDNPKGGTPSGGTGGDGTGDGTGDGQPTTRATAPATSGDGNAPEPDGQDTPATRPSGGPSDGASDRISQGTSDGGSESSSGTASGSGSSDGSGTGG